MVYIRWSGFLHCISIKIFYCGLRKYQDTINSYGACDQMRTGIPWSHNLAHHLAISATMDSQSSVCGMVRMSFSTINLFTYAYTRTHLYAYLHVLMLPTYHAYICRDAPLYTFPLDLSIPVCNVVQLKNSMHNNHETT